MNEKLGANHADPILFGIMAGKGGVGKTLISCNLARVISWSASVLLIDLDLYNRGSTALLVNGGVQPGTLTVYGLLTAAITRDGGRAPKLKLDAIDQLVRTEEPVKIDEQYYVLPSSITGDPIEKVEYELELDQTRELLVRVVSVLSDKYKLDCVIFDCKAGPDPLSMGVVGIAEETLLISEYNTITYDGTLNFTSTC